MEKTFADFGIDVPYGKGGEVDTTCPECSRSRKKKNAKCLSVNIDKGIWNCHHCGWSGTIHDGGKKATMLHWQKPIWKKPEAKPDKLTKAARDWLNARGITNEVIDRNRLFSDTVYMPQIEDKITAIGFPYYRDGELINVKYRDRDKNFRMEAGAERVLYGLHDIGEKTIIVEGEIDKLSVETAGITACVSVPDGAPTENTKDYSSKFDFLNEKTLDTVKTWVLAVDNDPPGKRLEEELSRRFGRENCLRVVWPEGCKDANDVLLKHGADVLKACIDNAKPYPIDGVYSVLDVSDDLDVVFMEGWPKGQSTGWNALDANLTILQGQMTIVTGIPSHGKSEWIDALSINLSSQGWVWGIYSPENHPIHFHVAKLMEKVAGTRFGSEKMGYDTYQENKKWINAHYHFILPEEPSLDEILERARVLVRRQGMNGLIIDPWNEIEHHMPAGMSETAYISLALTKIRLFARQNGVHVFVVAHPTKLQKGPNGAYPVPTPYDINGSAHWRNKADNCIAIWRDVMVEDGPTEVHVQKVRFRWLGKPGSANLYWQAGSGRYSERPKSKWDDIRSVEF